MKSALFVLLVSLFFIFISCKKDETKSDCEVNQYGTVTISNPTTHNYIVYIEAAGPDYYDPKLIKAGETWTKIHISTVNSKEKHVTYEREDGMSQLAVVSFYIESCMDNDIVIR